MALISTLPACATLSEFDLAREARYQDGLTLARNGRRMGAGYLLGYFIEMTFKCVFYRLLGYSPSTPLRITHQDDPRTIAKQDLGVQNYPHTLHNYRFWCDTIIRFRQEVGRPLDPGLSNGLRSVVERLAGNWRVDMRYFGDRMSREVFREFIGDTHWIRTNYDLLWS